MPTNIFIGCFSNTTDLTLDLSIKSSSKRSMLSIKATTIDNSSSLLTTSDPDGSGSSSNNSIIDNDEVKIFECEKHEEDIDIDGDEDNDRLSPVIKEEESSPQQTSSTTNLTDRLNSEQQLHSFFPYFISPYYHPSNATQSFDKLASLESLSKFISPPPAHMSNSNLGIDQNTGIPNTMYPLPSPTSFQSPYSQHWRSPMFPFVFPTNYPLSQNSSSHSISSLQKRSTYMRRIIENNPQQQQQSKFHEDTKQKKSHIKKPLNAFMLFMKEQRAQVVQECTLRESAAINQILGRKWHELDRNVQQKYYDMARDERMKHMQLYPGWSARDNYGVRKKRGNKGKKREKNQGENGECLNQKKCRARFGLDQQANWCKHCKRKKKCLRYTENETASIGISSWSEEDDTDNIDDSNDCDVIPINEHKNLSIHTGISMDSDEENKLRLLKYQQISNSNENNSNTKTSITMATSRKDSSSKVSFLQPYPYFDSFLSTTTSMPILNEFKRET
ncbi:unnamed protein product [Rotaria sordida]|uniref:HMG box domain-containing protein n=2 Tax=Rotaria sordida TaxID=392033 RepID=A0A815QQI1_9BILA|nr:unnamed protein product [Rotaria sordida]CAF1466473.1 unnamed protein product [Rotaria sordida]